MQTLKATSLDDLMPSTAKKLPSENYQERRRVSLEAQFRNLLALFDKVVASAIAAGAQSQNEKADATILGLDNCLFELRICVKNIRALVPGADSPLDSLRILDELEGPSASALRNVLSDLEKDVSNLSIDSTDSRMLFDDGFNATCDRVKRSIDQLDKLQDAFLEEIKARKDDIRDIVQKGNDNANRKLSVLCFDGGGVRSYSSLLILKALMDEIRSVIGEAEEEDSAGSTRPHEVFDYIFGSSSGGLIAIMLGRLNMTDEQCKDAFLAYSKSIFGHVQPAYRLLGPLTSKYNEKSLIRATKLVIGHFDPSPEGQKWKRNMFAAPDANCRCGVTAHVRLSSTTKTKEPKLMNDDPPSGVRYLFRTYDNPKSARNPGPANDCQIWQVAQATTAAPLYFPSAKFDEREFLDGGFGTNNPTLEAYTELSDLHPESHICIVSIGSGSGFQRTVSNSESNFIGRVAWFVEDAVNMATDTASSHETIQQLAASSDKLSYFRFVVPGLKHVRMDEWSSKVRGQPPATEKMSTVAFIKRQTQKYLGQAAIREQICTCARKVVESHLLRSRVRSNLGKSVAQSTYQISTRVEPAQYRVEGIFQVPARNNAFIGREIILCQISEHLGSPVLKENPRLQYCILHGLGGIGKTQIAIEYVHRSRGQYSCVFWVRASSERELADGYSSIASVIGYEDGNGELDSHQGVQPAKDAQITKEIQVVLNWLSNTDVTWLLVFDNAEHMESLIHYIPASKKGSIIITSRQANLAVPGALGVSVGPLDPKSGAELLYSIVLPEDIGDSREEWWLLASEISKELGGLPLALCQAGGYIRMSSISLAEYLPLFKDKRVSFRHSNAMTWQYKQTLDTVWDVTFSSLSPDARNLIECMAFLDPDSIPEEIFFQKHDPLSSAISSMPHGNKFRDARMELHSYSLVLRQSRGNQHTYSLHRMVKFALLQRLKSDPKKYLKVFSEAFSLVRAFIPRPTSQTDSMLSPTNWPTFRRYLSHVLCLNEAHDRCDQQFMEAKDDLDFAELLLDMGLYLKAIGSFKREGVCEQLLKKAQEKRTFWLGPQHPDTLRSMGDLASMYCDQGLWIQAEGLGLHVVKTLQKVLGEEHPYTLTSIANLASVYRAQGRWRDAEKLDMQGLETSQKVLGEEHPSTLTSMANLASTYRNQGRWKEAEELDVQVKETSLRVLGPEHPSTLTSTANLASTYWNQGRWKEAEELEVQVKETSLRVLGPEHPSTLTSMANLASTYRNQRRWKEAEELEVQVKETSLRVLGPEHPSTLTSMANLASTYRNQGRWKEAEELDVQVKDTSLRVLGPEHPSTLTSMANLASTYRNQGRWKEAEELDVQVKETSLRVLGPEYPSTLTSMGTHVEVLKPE